ncbi:hypothetical protein C8J56DRAFT_772777 [Mycena floridula]|nr:hypothetical protein C8J56DRAFT_772777 [Mycena floridula]
MLLVHADSTCDVCLDPYNFDSGQSRFPYAIPCGHIFCLGCLESLSPAVCPLCRKAFTTERVKKLHMAAPDVNPEQAYVDRILDSWEAEQDDLVQLTTEVDNWLSAREGGSVSQPPNL